MKQRGPFLMLVTVGLTALVACAPAAPSPAAAPPKAAPPPAAKAEQPAAKADWQAEWEKVVAAAKKEGVVQVAAPPGDLLRENVRKGFGEAFPEIALQWTGARTTETATKLESERRAGVYNLDVLIGGTTTVATQMSPMGALDPIKPALLLPEVTTPDAWRGGQLAFADPEAQYNLTFVNIAYPFVAYDQKQVHPEEVDELQELLDPKWTGKIVMEYPLQPGAGQLFSRWVFEVLGPQKGAEYVRALRGQAGAVDRDERRLMESVVRGRYPILVPALTGPVMTQMFQQGLQFGIVPEFKEVGTATSASFGSLVLINRAPHPNAAKVFINWFLGKDGQTAYTISADEPSRRLDVRTDHLPEWAIPKPGVKYWESYKWDKVKMSSELESLLKELFG